MAFFSGLTLPDILKPWLFFFFFFETFLFLSPQNILCLFLQWLFLSPLLLSSYHTHTPEGNFNHFLDESQVFSSSQSSVSSVQFSRSVVSDSLLPHESQHSRPPCPSPTPGVHSDSRPSSHWYHPAISSSVVPFSSCPQSLPPSESFPMSQLFSWGGQSTGVSALASLLPKNTQDWSSEWTGWISLQCKGLKSYQWSLQVEWKASTPGRRRTERQLGNRNVCVCMYVSLSVVCNSLRPHGLQPTRLLYPWDFPGKNTEVSCHFLLQEIFPPRDRTQFSCIADQFFTMSHQRYQVLYLYLFSEASQSPWVSPIGNLPVFSRVMDSTAY